MFVKKLLAKTTVFQRTLFLEKILKEQPPLVEDLKIFLQGRRQTPVTVADYKIRFRNQLEQLDLKELLEMWYREGEDYDGGGRYDLTTESLEETVDELIDPAEKYAANQNYAEALKIYQAVFEALWEKQQTLKGDLADLADWFSQEMERVIADYAKTLTEINDKNLREVGIGFLCRAFRRQSIYVNKEQLLTCLKQAVSNKAEAELAASCLKLQGKRRLAAEESALLAFLLSLSGKWREFEMISLKNLQENPGLALDLFRYYQKNNRKEEIIKVAGEVLDGLMKKGDGNFYFGSFFNYKETEIRIRRFLREIYFEDYLRAIANLERLFLVTGSLDDYRELVKNYRNQAEKEKFWQTIKKHFNNAYLAKNVFKVFELENQKEEVLRLINQYPEAEYFPDMIAFTSDVFPRECFDAYQRKIEALLRVADVQKYAAAAGHLAKLDKGYLLAEKKINGRIG